MKESALWPAILIRESWKHSMAWVGRGLRDHLVLSLHLQAGLPTGTLDQVAQVPTNLALNTSYIAYNKFVLTCSGHFCHAFNTLGSLLDINKTVEVEPGRQLSATKQFAHSCLRWMETRKRKRKNSWLQTQIVQSHRKAGNYAENNYNNRICKTSDAQSSCWWLWLMPREFWSSDSPTSKFRYIHCSAYHQMVWKIPLSTLSQLCQFCPHQIRRDKECGLLSSYPIQVSIARIKKEH